jgi:anti-anti-sigma regulatory factor
MFDCRAFSLQPSAFSLVMTSPAGKILVSVGETCGCVKITGRANFTSSVDFSTLLNELLHKGFTRFVLDLTDCTLMDSTFLGVLAGFGLRITGPQADLPGRTIELFNPNPRIAELLENLGVLHLFQVTQGDVKLPEPTQPQERTEATPTRAEVTQTCLEAHQTLMGIHPENVSRFKDVAQFLAEDLKKLKAEK